MQLKLYLDKPRQETSPIILSISFRNQRVKCGTGVVIPVIAWEPEKQRIKRSYADSFQLNDSLDSLKGEVKKIYGMMELSQIVWDNNAIKEFKERINIYRNPRKLLSVEPEKVSVDFKETLQDFIDNYITPKGMRPKDSTMKGYRTLKKRLEEFEIAKKYKLTFETITPEFYKQFVNYLYTVEKLTDNAVGKYIKNTIVFMRDCQNKGLHTTEFYKDFKVIERDADTVFNTQEEIDAIEALDLSFSKRLNDSRNMYLLQIYCSGMRYSDFIQLKPEHFHLERDRIIFHTQKTRKVLMIAITEKVKGILAKYPDLIFPFISNQKQNQYIKEICRIADLTQNVILSKYRGTERIDTIMPKYEAIGTHTARRTFITLSLKMGIAKNLLKLSTGHVDDRSFNKYDRLTEEIACEAVANAWK